MFECTKCKEMKVSSEYYSSSRYSTGIRQPCKVCIKEHGKRKREEYQREGFKEIPSEKLCKSCDRILSSENFHKRKDTPTGLRSECKECTKETRHEHYMENREIVLKRTKLYQQENKEKYAEWKRIRYWNDPDLAREQAKAYMAKDPDKWRQYHNQWAKDNPEIVKKSQKAYYDRNVDKIKEKRRVWAAKNKDKVCYYASKRRAMIKGATPCWADQEVIKSFYHEATFWGESIDHIIPLSHPLVCGLHCEFNLQMMPIKDNIKKNNSFEISEHELPDVNNEL